MLGNRSQRYSMNWPYCSGLISAELRNVRVTLTSGCPSAPAPARTSEKTRTVSNPNVVIIVLGSGRESLTGCERIQPVEMFAIAHGYQNVTRLEGGVEAGIKDHFAGGFLDGDNDDAEVLPQPAVIDR